MDEKDFQINQKIEVSKKKHAALKRKSINRRDCPRVSCGDVIAAPNHTEEERRSF